MNRRQFLKQFSLWSAGLIAAPPVFDLIPKAISSQTPSLISVAKGEQIRQMVQSVVQSLGGISNFVKKGDKVVIKPNIAWDRNIELAANTHPDVVSTLVELCLDAGASKVRVFDNPCNEPRRCYHNSGIKPALEKIRDRRLSLDHIDKRKFIPVTINNGTSLKKWPFYKDALEADCYINVPVAKNHSWSDLSIGLKNIMGAIGGIRGRLHIGLEEKLADLNTVIRPDLNIVDATRVIVKNGPQGGSLGDVKKMDTIIGSADIVAVDAYTSTLFGFKPEELSTTVAAHKKGLGQMDLKKCDIKFV